MDPTRWHRLAELFLELVDLDPVARSSRLDDATRDDPSLRGEVEAMLAAHEPTGGLSIERRLLAVAGAPAELDPLPVGTVLGSYALGPVVGEGGMGEVYRAERIDGEYRQTVALKLLRPGWHAADAVRRFRTERQLLARLVHPDIVPILDGGTAPDGRPFLVLQFVEGTPVTEYCDHAGLGLEARLRLFQRIAEAVQFAHGQLVVHRDLKPSNILVQADGSPRLLDFGIAKLLDDDGGEAHPATRPEVRLLSPEHAAPEQLRGEPVGTATDVYGLGVLLYELVTGRRPFRSAGRTSEEFTRTLLTDPPPLPSTVAQGAVPRQRLRGDLDRIVAMALRKEPERRYRSAGEFAEDVERFLQGRPVRAQRDTLPYRVRKFVGRNRAGVVAGGVLAALVLGFAGVSSTQARRIAVERDRAQRERAAAEEVLGVLTSLFQRSNPRLVPGADTVRVGALVDEAEARLEALADHPERQFALWRTVGQLRTARGEFARARDLLARAWEAHGTRTTISPQERANLHHEWAMAVLAADGAEAALPMLVRSVEQLRAIHGDAHLDVAIALGDRASADPDPEVRARLLAEARAIRERLGSRADIQFAAQLNQEGTSLFREGRGVEALARFEEALEILGDFLPPEHPNRLAVSNNATAALLDLARWSEAEALLLETQRHQTPAATPQQRANTLELLGVTFAHQGRMEEAEDHFRRSLDLARDSAATRLPNTFRNLGALLTLTGRAPEALPLLDTALVLVGPRGEGNADGRDVMALQRALALLELDRTAEALAVAVSSIEALRASMPETSGRRADVELAAGVIALEAGDLERAEASFVVAVTAAEAAGFPRHPRRAAARCGLAVVRTRLGRPLDDADPGAACDEYAAWGLALPPLLAAAARVRSAFDVQSR